MSSDGSIPAGFYREEPQRPLSEETRSLFAFTNPERFSKISEDELCKHVIACRNKTYARIPYPCLGRFRFLEAGSRSVATYQRAVDHIKADPSRKILDMGCGFAQDVRAWIQDGVKGEQVVGADLKMDFVQDGFELFGDALGKAHLRGVSFESCDIFKDEDVQRVKAKSRDGKGYDVIYIGSFLHLFNYGERVVSIFMPR
jgi:SAM-dependent methyltransferase